LRASTVANRLLSRRFCDDFRVPELARISPRGEHDAIRAHRARHPCVVGRPPLARTRSRHKHSTARGSAECASCEHARMGTKSPRREGHRTCRLTGSAQSAQRTPKNRKTAASKGEARLIDPCNASAHQGPAHGDGLRRPTGESSHRSSRHHGAASMPLDPPPGTDPTTQLAAQQPRFTPKRRGVPIISSPNTTRPISYAAPSMRGLQAKLERPSALRSKPD
jgi:hypothetical protein